MKTAKLRLRKGFRGVSGNRASQSAEMVLQPGESEGGPENRHPGSDQWLYVISGTGMAIVAGKRHRLGAETLILIERGETHEIRNTGDEPLRTLDVYVPPAYTDSGGPIPRRGTQKTR